MKLRDQIVVQVYRCEGDAPGARTHLRERDLPRREADGRSTAGDIGDPDDCGARRLRLLGTVPVDVRCHCGAFVRRRTEVRGIT